MDAGWRPISFVDIFSSSQGLILSFSPKLTSLVGGGGIANSHVFSPKKMAPQKQVTLTDDSSGTGRDKQTISRFSVSD